MYKPVLIVLLGVVGFLWAQNPDSSWMQDFEQDDFDSLSVSFLSNWPFADARAVAYDNSRQLTFLASGGGVYIMDVSTPANPIKLSEKIHTRGYVYNLFYDITFQRLYIANGVLGFEIWDVANPVSPNKLGEWEAQYEMWDVYVRGQYAYVVDKGPLYQGGLYIIDVSNPANPQEVGYCDTPGYSQAVFISGDYAYVAENNAGFSILNISNPLNPYVEGTCETNDVATDVYVVGNYAYIADFNAGLCIVDVSDPVNPYIIGQCDTPDRANGIYVTGSYAYVAGCEGGLRVINVLNPEEPYEVGYYDTPGCAWAVSTSGVYAYVADHVDGLRIIDITQPSNPFEVGYYNARSSALDIQISGSYAYLADRGAGLRVIDISTASNPHEIGNCDTPSEAYGIAKSGDYVCIADYNTGLHVIDVSTPTNPIHVGFCSLSGHARKVFIQGQYAYVAAADAGFHIVDISSPTNPFYVGGHNTPLPGSGMDIYVVDDYAYLADSMNGLRIYDITTPSNPNYIGQCNTPDAALGIFVQNNYAYVAASDAGLRVIDTSNPENPFEIGYYITDGVARDVFIEGFYAYVSYHGYDLSGICALDISAPDNPTQVGYYNNNYWTLQSFCLTAKGGYLYSGTYRSGLQIYESAFLSIETDDPYALAYNGNRHLVREPGTENLHMVYTNDAKVAYRYSSDGGDNWTASKTVGEGEVPAIDLARQTNPCIAWTLGNSLFFSKKEQTEWVTTEYTFGALQPYHPCMAITTPEEVDIDTVHILVRLYDDFFSTNYIKEISFPITYPQRYQVRTVDASSGANMITLDFPSVSRDFTNTLHATWQHGDTIFYGTRPERQNWNVWGWQFQQQGLQSAHPFTETYGDSIFVVWQNELDEEVYRGARHLGWLFFSWTNLSQTSTTPSTYPVNASGMVTTFVDKLSALSEYDVFWRTRPADPLHNLSNSGFVESMYPQTCLRILDEQEPPFQYTVWQEGNEAPYEIKFAKTQIIPDRNTQSSSAYFTSIPGDSIPSLYLVERDSFITDWQIPVDIGVQRVIYAFPLLPPYFYKAKIIAYHEFQGQRQMKVNIDGGIQTTVNYSAAHAETLELWIPPALYEDSLVTIELQGINTGLTVGPIYIYRYECGSGGKISGGPQSTDMNPLATIKYSKGNIFAGQVRFDVELPFDLETEMTLYDATGRLLRKMKVTKKVEFTENNLAAGVYFLRIDNPLTGKAATMKFIKIK